MIEIVPCQLAHLRAIAPRLRAEERAELAALDMKARHALFELWRETIAPKAALLGAEVVAVWGDMAPPLSREGLLWLFTSPAIEGIPITFARVAKHEVGRMLGAREVLRSSVHRSCARALRFYRMLGFEVIAGTAREGFLEIRLSRGFA